MWLIFEACLLLFFDRQVWAKSADPDQTAPKGDQDL